MAKITKDFINRVKPEDDYKTHWDDQLKGYGLRVSPKGKKVFVVMGRVKGVGKAICLTLGPVTEMAEHKAREEAKDILNDKFRKGIDPRAEARAALAEKVEEAVALTTLSQTLDGRNCREKPEQCLWRRAVGAYLARSRNAEGSARCPARRIAALSCGQGLARADRPYRSGCRCLAIAAGRSELFYLLSGLAGRRGP